MSETTDDDRDTSEGAEESGDSEARFTPTSMPQVREVVRVSIPAAEWFKEGRVTPAGIKALDEASRRIAPAGELTGGLIGLVKGKSAETACFLPRWIQSAGTYLFGDGSELTGGGASVPSRSRVPLARYRALSTQAAFFENRVRMVRAVGPVMCDPRNQHTDRGFTSAEYCLPLKQVALDVGRGLPEHESIPEPYANGLNMLVGDPGVGKSKWVEQLVGQVGRERTFFISAGESREYIVPDRRADINRAELLLSLDLALENDRPFVVLESIRQLLTLAGMNLDSGGIDRSVLDALIGILLPFRAKGKVFLATLNPDTLRKEVVAGLISKLFGIAQLVQYITSNKASGGRRRMFATELGGRNDSRRRQFDRVIAEWPHSGDDESRSSVASTADIKAFLESGSGVFKG